MSRFPDPMRWLLASFSCAAGVVLLFVFGLVAGGVSIGLVLALLPPLLVGLGGTVAAARQSGRRSGLPSSDLRAGSAYDTQR